MNSKQSILITMGYSVPFAGAGWRRLSYIIDSLLTNNKVYLLSSFNISSLKKIKNMRYKSSKIFRVPLFLSTNIIMKLFAILTYFLATLLLLLTTNVKVLLLSLPPGDPCVGSFLAGQLMKKKIIIDYRDEYGGSVENPIIFANKPYYRMMLSKSDSIVVVTNRLSQNLRKKIKESKVTFIPNLVDTSRFKPLSQSMIGATRRRLGFNSNDFILIYVGLLSLSVYNIETVIRALKIAKGKGIKDIHFLFAGSGQAKDRILNLADRLDLQNRVRYLGQIQNPNKLSKIIASADLGLVPYARNKLLKNTVSMKFYEYCSCGIPVIATSYLDSEISELICKNKLGLVSRPDDPVDLFSKILLLYQNSAVRRRFGKNVRDFVKKYYSAKTIQPKYIELIYSVSTSSAKQTSL